MNTTAQQELLNRPVYTSIRIVRYVVDILEFLLFIRFLLIFFSANASAQFTTFIYNATNPLIQPFSHIFPSYTFAYMTIDWTTLFAIFLYWIVALLVIKLLFFIIKSDLTTE